MRLGVFGGSFDPPHIGHFLAAVDAADHLALDRVLWVPAAHQPLKTATPHIASPEQRYAMVAAATGAHSRFTPSRIEIDREGLSYTVETLEALKQQYPAAERFLLLGEDAWEGFAQWHQPERIRTLVQVAVLKRPAGTPQGRESDPVGIGALSEDSADSHGIALPDRQIPSRTIDVSATEIRARIKAGKPIRGFVQDAVADIIESEGLYRW